MISQKTIVRESFRAIGETCPAVDAAFEVCIEVVKSQTNALRDAMHGWIERALEAEEKVKDLEAKIDDLESLVDELRGELKSIAVTS